MVPVRRTVLLVDDHAGFRASARALLDADGRLHVIGEAGTGTEAVGAVSRLHPDIVLLDIVLPDVDGFAVCESIMRDQAHRPVVVLTSSRSPTAYKARLDASPARGFIGKDELSAAALLALTE
jgi:DNA-binding NarL/FixJ family response regulator